MRQEIPARKTFDFKQSIALRWVDFAVLGHVNLTLFSRSYCAN